jgi:hypothetical protein
MTALKNPIHELPPGYREVQHLKLLEPGIYLLINLMALIPLAVALVVMSGWWALVLRLRGGWPGGFGADWPWWLWLILLLVLSIVIHEALHGLVIAWAGHKPRFGMMLSKGAFYATADNALFPRDTFIAIALAPIIGITLLGMALMVILPDMLGYYVGLMVVLNAANSIGDLWMTVAVLRYPRAALVRDEMDSIRIYTTN